MKTWQILAAAALLLGGIGAAAYYLFLHKYIDSWTSSQGVTWKIYQNTLTGMYWAESSTRRSPENVSLAYIMIWLNNNGDVVQA